MESPLTYRITTLLRQVQLLGPAYGQSTPELQELYNTICKLVFDGQTCQGLWDEPILSQLEWLFGIKPPEPTTFGNQVAELCQHGQQAKHINDFFFRILSWDCSVEDVYEALARLSPAQSSILYRLKSSDRLAVARATNALPSEKIASYLGFLKDDLGLDLADRESVKGCLNALKAREGAGMVNALLAKVSGKDALVVPLQIRVTTGAGQVHDVVHNREDFKKAVERARHAMRERGFLNASEDVLYTLDLTEPEYQGASIGLAATVAIYAAARATVIDPYTAFTGDINWDRGNWRVRGVSSLREKLDAARLSGCRRVFIPQENINEVPLGDQKSLQIIPVEDPVDVLLKLQAPLQPLAGDSIQVRKINAVKGFCQAQGWDLSLSEPIQNGVQFRVAPLKLPHLVVSIYNKGSHVPQNHDRLEYQQLLDSLRSQEASTIPIRKIEEKFNLQDTTLRAEIRETLEHLQPVDQRKEAHCEYMFRFERGHEHLVVKQYEKGTLQIQGTAGDLYKDILEPIILRYNLRYPKAQLPVEALLRIGETVKATTSSQPLCSGSVQEVPLPHIGTDESGKGDYFGPLVVAGVFLDAQTMPKLEALGVKDSKLLSDKRCHELAVQIRQICRERFEQVEIPPETYNKRYEDFRREGKNLNVLLAWGHARAIESLLERSSCSYAVADQFGDERYILSKLMEKGKQVKLVQLPKGERYIAVAAASILARDKFLARLEKLSREYGIELPKGASDLVVTAARRIVEAKGSAELRKVAKLHHKTTQKILGQG